MEAEKGTALVQSLPAEVTEEAELSFQFTKQEHALGWWDAMRLHYPAIGWGLFMNTVSQKFSDCGSILILLGNRIERH
jgi:hypothetical protein